MVVLALLLQRVLHLEQIGEVAAGVDPHVDVDGLGIVIEDRDVLAKTTSDGALADHRELGIDVDGAGPRDEEVAGLVVLQVVRRQRVQPLPVRGKGPLRQESRVEEEETGRIGRRRLDVALAVADYERVTVENLHQIRAHDILVV